MISIITATYNAVHQLPGLVASLGEQTEGGFEWVVADGGSTDGTQNILKEAQGLNLQWESRPDFGLYEALNKAIDIATGEYYVVVGADDTLAPDAVGAFVEAVRGTSADIIAAPVAIGQRVIHPQRSLSWLRSGPPFVAAHSVGTLIRRGLHDEIGPYSRRYPIAADTLFLLEAGLRGKRFAYIDTVVGRFGLDGVSSKDRLGALCESFRANVEVRGHYWQQLPLFAARLLINGLTIAKQAHRSERPSHKR